MIDFLTRNAFWVILVCSSAVMVPLLIGYVLGDLHRATLSRIALPLAGGTFLLLTAMHLLRVHSTSWIRIGFSFAFGSILLLSGLHVLRRHGEFFHDATEKDPRRFASTMGWCLLIVGAVWLAVGGFVLYDTY